VSRISELEEFASEIVIGTDPEFAQREDGLPRIEEVYGFKFNNYQQGLATASENPDVVEIIKELDGRIDTDSMRELNYQYDVDKKEARDIARDFLVQQGLIAEK